MKKLKCRWKGQTERHRKSSCPCIWMRWGQNWIFLTLAVTDSESICCRCQSCIFDFSFTDTWIIQHTSCTPKNKRVKTKLKSSSQWKRQKESLTLRLTDSPFSFRIKINHNSSDYVSFKYGQIRTNNASCNLLELNWSTSLIKQWSMTQY